MGTEKQESSLPKAPELPAGLPPGPAFLANLSYAPV